MGHPAVTEYLWDSKPASRPRSYWVLVVVAVLGWGLALTMYVYPRAAPPPSSPPPPQSPSPAPAWADRLIASDVVPADVAVDPTTHAIYVSNGDAALSLSSLPVTEALIGS